MTCAGVSITTPLINSQYCSRPTTRRKASSHWLPRSDNSLKMLDRLMHALVESGNQAADDLLLQALRLGNRTEQTVALDALFRRETPHGLRGILALFERLPEQLQSRILRNIKAFH